jgi:Ca2+-transporting ATPase
MTMTFVVMGLGTVFNALTNRREPASGLTPPILKALAIALVPVALIVPPRSASCSAAFSPTSSPASSGWLVSLSRWRSRS